MDYLVEHALKNVWCAPLQDNQLIFQPARLSAYSGVFSSWRGLMTYLPVPEVGYAHHIFQVGQIHPLLVALFPRKNQWINLAEASQLNNAIYDVYFGNGMRVPLAKCWYAVTEEKNLVFAIREIPELTRVIVGGVTTSTGIQFGRDPIYIRVYKNAYFKSDRHTPGVDGVLVKSAQALTTEDIRLFQDQHDENKTKKGFSLVYRNGHLIKTAIMVTCQIGDWIEIVHDTSIKRVEYQDLADLKTFVSKKDKKRKYILSTLGQKSDTIEFYDDADFYLVNNTTGSGVLYHKNSAEAIRMVTHQAYSTPVNLVQSFLTSNTALIPGATARFQIVTRDSGYTRTLAKNANRVNELYKLDPSKLADAMVGVDSHVSAWRAEALEDSEYTAIMSSKAAVMNKSTVARAYGYNGCADVLAKVIHPTSLFSTQVGVALPEAFKSNVTGFEYDSEGLLLGWNWHEAGSIYNCVYPGASFVEFVHGSAGPKVGDTYNTAEQLLDPNYDYRFYTLDRSVNPQTTPWSDSTGAAGMYAIAANTLKWAVNTTHFTIVRSNKTPFVKRYSFDVVDGLIQFNLTTDRFVNGLNVSQVVEVPFGELDVWLNRRLLIKNLDYFVEHPTLTIVNKEFLVETGPQDIVVRGKGMCDKNLGDHDGNEFGFIFGGRLSADREFDVRDDKSIRVQVAGRLVLPGGLKYNEDDQTFEMLHAWNGMPYSVKDTITPLKGYTGVDTYVLKEESNVVDREVSQFLTKKIPQVPAANVSVIPKKYAVYSPFICKIMMDLKAGIFAPAFLNGQYTNADVASSVVGYLRLLKHDPILPENQPQQDFVSIHPHCFKTQVNLTVQQYAFINRLILIYASGLMTLSAHAMIN